MTDQTSNTKDLLKVSSVIIRPTPLGMVYRSLGFMIASSLAYALLAFGTEYLQSDGTFALFGVLEIDVFAFLVLILANVIFMLWAALAWACEYYELHEGEIIHFKGILRRQEMSISLQSVETMDFDQGILGRMFRYGTILAHSPLIKIPIRLLNISDPAKELPLIKLASQSLKDTIVPVQE